MLPADRIGLHRVGVYLCLMDKTALDASQCPSARNRYELRNALDLRARLAFGTTRPPPREAIGCVFVDRATIPPVGSGESAAELSLSPIGADGRAVIAVVCRLGITTRWSILLTLRDLTLPSTFVAGGTLAGIRHWLSWRRPMSHYYFGVKDGHWSRWICVAAICLGLAPNAEAGEHSGLVHRISCTVVRYYVVKYTASAAETWARSKGATEAEIEAARLCLKATPMQTARITTPALGRE